MSREREVMSKNLQKYIKRKGVDQKDLAEYLNVSEMSVSNWISGNKYPRISNVQKIADYFGVKKTDLIEEKSEKYNVFTSSKYPIYPSVSAGVPVGIDGVTEIESETISVPDYLLGKWAGNKDIYFTRTNGESMNNIMPHDTLIAVKQVELHELKDSDIVVYRNHGEYAVKRFYKDGDRLIYKRDSKDKRFADDVINVNDADDLTISGKVVTYIVNVD